jgi:hypothetical protein
MRHMPRLNPADKMTALLKKQEEIANQLKQLKAREKETERKADTRRKVIAGALALEHFAQHPESEFARVLFKLLNDHVEERSRHLFGFLPSPNPPAAASMAAAGREATAPS